MTNKAPARSVFWTKRRTLSRLPAASNHGSAAAAAPSSFGTSNSSESIASLNINGIVRATTVIKNKPRVSQHNYVFIFLVLGVFLLLGNSFFLFVQLNDADTKNVGMFFLPHHHERLPKLFHRDGGQGEPNLPPTIQPTIINDALFLAERLYKMENTIAKNLSIVQTPEGTSNMDIQSCRKINCRNILEDNTSNSHPKQVVYYNDWEHPRFLCGKRIEPHGLLVLNSTDDTCHDGQQQYTLATIFPVLPTRSNQINKTSPLPPIKLGIKGVRLSRSVQFTRFRGPCDVNCHFLHNNLNSLAIFRTIEGTPWEIGTSMEGPQYYDSLQAAPQTSDRYLATTSFDSDIPLPYFSWDDYAPEGKATVPGVNYDQAIKGAVFMARNCKSRNHREALVKTLIQKSEQYNNSTASSSFKFRIDSVSRCLHNHDPPPTTNQDDKNEIVGQYLFYLAFENQNAEDYITEKLWGALFRTGTVPVYVGAANVKDHVPSGSIISVHDFANEDALWQYLLKVAQNRTLYESYHTWRDKPLPESFVRKYNFTHVHSTCRMCRWAFAKRYGWGWDHAQQAIEEKEVLGERKLCWGSDTGLLNHPFREQWMSANFRELNVQMDPSTASDLDSGDHDVGQSTVCQVPLDNIIQNHTHTILLENGAIRRTIWSHDGILDMFVEPVTPIASSDGHSLVLEMEVPALITSDGKAGVSHNSVGRREFWLQSGNFRFTVLTNQNVIWTNHLDERVKLFLSLHADTTFRMRVLIEHVDARRRPESLSQSTYFGQMAANDFFQPLEKFVVSEKPATTPKAKLDGQH